MSKLNSILIYIKFDKFIIEITLSIMSLITEDVCFEELKTWFNSGSEKITNMYEQIQKNRSFIARQNVEIIYKQTTIDHLQTKNKQLNEEKKQIIQKLHTKIELLQHNISLHKDNLKQKNIELSDQCSKFELQKDTYEQKQHEYTYKNGVMVELQESNNMLQKINNQLNNDVQKLTIKNQELSEFVEDVITSRQFLVITIANYTDIYNVKSTWI